MPKVHTQASTGHKSLGIARRPKDYIALVDATGRLIRKDKSGAIDAGLNPILQRLNIDTDTWLMMATEFEEANARGRLGLGRLRQKARSGLRASQEEMDLQHLSPPKAAPNVEHSR